MTTAQVASIDWDALEPSTDAAELPPPVDNTPADSVPLRDVPRGHCKVCGQEIADRRPRQRYHDECRPSAAKTGAARTAIGSDRTQAKKEREAQEAVDAFRSKLVQSLVLVSAFDRYDTFVIMVSLPNAMESLKGVLVRYDKLRAEMLALKGGGSIFGLVVSLLCMALPILAHHGLIPHRQARALLMNLPFTLHEINKRLKDGEATLTNIMEEQLKEQAKRNRENENKAKATPDIVDANADS